MKNEKDIFDFNTTGNKAPFDLPPAYFETFEDRLEARIRAAEEKPNTRRTIMRVLRPVVGLAASFLVILLVVKYPLTKFAPELLGHNDGIEQSDSAWFEERVLDNTAFFDDRALVQSMTTEETATPANSEELINYLSSEMNDYELFAELNK